MFGLISKKKLADVLKFLIENNDPDKASGNTGEERVKDFYWRCGNANAVEYICLKTGVKL